MRKLIIALTFCLLGLLGTIHTGNTGNEAGQKSHDPQESSDTDLQSIECLAETKLNEVLPLFIFTNLPEYKYQNRYQMPEKLVKFELNDGKIAQGTKFMPRQPGNETFLCPKENSAEKCLVRKSFGESEPLRCSSEPTPQWSNTHKPCSGGDMGSGTRFSSVYTICESEDFDLNPKSISFYEICYDTQLHKVIYATNTIKSWALLNLKLLTHERSIEYPIVISDDSIFSNHPISQDIINERTEKSKKPQYQLQQLVSHTDMPLATWRKTTFSSLNYEWMHEELVCLWDEISAYIRSIAKEYSTSEEVQLAVNTAIIDINPSDDDNELCNIWMKEVFVMSNLRNPIFTHGIVIFMNNFLHENECSSDKQTAIEKYCHENLCIEELTKKFTQIGGRIRCCRFTSQILKLFEFEIDVMEELQIPNVTVAKNHETLYSRDQITWEQARETLREIQQNEILPLILMMKDYGTVFTFHLPADILKIEITNKRIVQGSEFSTSYTKKQFFFCPKEDTDEKCLYIKTFGRFEPLQCAKAAVPMIKKKNEGDNICGFNDDEGTLYEVGYEICPMETPDNKLFQSFYDFCYNMDNKQILFTHHRIVSPKLLFTNLLLRERDMQHFTMATDDSVPISPSQNEKSKPGYHLQQLVPFEDMAFALWENTTHRRINADWQHKKLTSLWNKINIFIRATVQKYDTSWQKDARVQNAPFSSHLWYTNEVDNYINTGVFDIEYESADQTDDQIYNIWVKRIRIDYYGPKEVVIFMNNFLVTDQRAPTSPNSKHNEIQKYCKESLCLDSITKDFQDIGGQIMCCPMNPKIAKLFGLQEANFEAEALFIPGITKQNEIIS